MRIARLLPLVCLLFGSPFAKFVGAQSRVGVPAGPDVEHALETRPRQSLLQTRQGGYAPAQSKASLPRRAAQMKGGDAAVQTDATPRRPPARLIKSKALS